MSICIYAIKNNNKIYNNNGNRIMLAKHLKKKIIENQIRR